MSFNAWPDNEVRDDKFVGHEVQVQRPAFLEPLAPNAASEHSSESLSRALSAAISSHELLMCNSSHVSSNELMRATVERRDAMTTVRDALDLLPPDALIDEPMIRQRYPQVPGWLPQLLQVALGGEKSTLGAGIAEHAAAVTLPIMLEPAGSQGFSSLMNTFGERVVAAQGRTKSEGGASRRSGIVSAAASLLGLRFETTPAPVQAEHRASLIDQDVWVESPNCS